MGLANSRSDPIDFFLAAFWRMSDKFRQCPELEQLDGSNAKNDCKN